MAILGKGAARILKKAAKPGIRAKGPLAKEADKAIEAVPAPSPNPMTNMILADIALRSGGALLRRVVEQGLLGRAVGSAKAKKVIKGRSMTQTLVGTAIARLATRSVPGAILIGGGMLAKALYDRKHAGQAAADGEKSVDEQADRGRS